MAAAPGRRRPVCCLLRVAWLWLPGWAAAADKTAVVSVKWPASLAGHYAGTFPSWATIPAVATEQLRTLTPGDRHGCSPYPGGTQQPFVALVWSGGGCSAHEQAKQAEDAGAAGLAVVIVPNKTQSSYSGEYHAEVESDNVDVKIFVVGLEEHLGDELGAWNADHPEDPARLTFEVYALNIFSASELVLVAMATSLIVLGAFFATADLRLGSPIAPRTSEEVVEVDGWFPLAFCVGGSIMLVVLFFLMRFLIYIIIGAFCLGGGLTLWEVSQAGLRYYWPCLQRRLCRPYPGVIIELAHVIAGIVSALIVVTWFVLRNDPNGWWFQDIIGAAFLCAIQRTLRLPDMKLAAALLTIMFFFDIFWVFISPAVFGKSVMVEVATGGGTGETVPMLLRIPAVGDPLGHQQMLGFGDVAIPGLLASFLRRFDVLSRRTWRNGYFAPVVCGYVVGLVATLIALSIMQIGQPALLYLVPCTLGTTLVLAVRRGELGNLWSGTPQQLSDGLTSGDSLCCYCPGGHRLQQAAAESGSCDGCRKAVQVGQLVMACHACAWHLCRDCRPVQGGDQDVVQSPPPSSVADVGQV